MKRHIPVAWLGALIISGGLLACGGDDDDDDDGDNGGGGGTPNISGVIPGEVFVGRGADVLIVGDNTEWADGVEVSFGDGIAVGEVTVASPTALLVSIDAEGSAALGTRDVTVDDLTFAGAFELVSPIRVSSVQGTLAQGSVSVLNVQNLDFANPFDSTALLEASAGAGVQLVGGTIEAFAVSFTVLVDVNATSGARDLEILSSAGDQETAFRLAGALPIAERAAIPIELGEAETGNVAGPFDSYLYQVSATGPNLLTAETLANAAGVAPAVVVLPSSGSFADLLDFSPFPLVATEGSFYVIFWDNTGASEYQFSVQADVLTPLEALIAETEPNDDRAAAAAPAGAPAVVDNATLGAQEDEDWVQVTLSAEEVGEGIGLRAMTFGPDGLTDTVVSIFQGEEAVPIAVSEDTGFLDEVTADITAAGTYYIQVTPSPPPFFDPEHAFYNVAVLLE